MEAQRGKRLEMVNLACVYLRMPFLIKNQIKTLNLFERKLNKKFYCKINRTRSENYWTTIKVVFVRVQTKPTFLEKRSIVTVFLVTWTSPVCQRLAHSTD